MLNAVGLSHAPAFHVKAEEWQYLPEFVDELTPRSQRHHC